MSSPEPDPGVEIAQRLRMACAAHESELDSHLANVARYACALGRETGMNVQELHDLRHAVPLHDLGKIGIPHDLLSRPSRFGPEEMSQIQEHTLIGFRILDGSRWSVIQCAARIALSHHENWDGSGYPHGLRGEQIPLEARVCAVADVYDALRSRRSYKEAWSETAVLDEMLRLRGTKFEPRLLDAFLGLLPVLEASAA